MNISSIRSTSLDPNGSSNFDSRSPVTFFRNHQLRNYAYASKSALFWCRCSEPTSSNKCSCPAKHSPRGSNNSTFTKNFKKHLQNGNKDGHRLEINECPRFSGALRSNSANLKQEELVPRAEIYQNPCFQQEHRE